MTTPSRDWKEVIPPGEEAEFEKLAAEMATLGKERDGNKHRVLHPKRHLGARATLEIRADLPEHAKQGLFAKPGTHHCYVRLSNGAARFQHDREPDLRGFALKVLDVDGKKVLGDARTQDFLMVDTPKLPFRSVDEFMAVLRAGQDPKKLPQRLISALGFFSAIGLITRVLGTVKGKRGSLADLTYYTAAAIAFGPYAARVSLTPTHAADGAARAGAEKDYLRDEVQARHGKHGFAFDVRAQFFTSEAVTPVERSDVDWPAEWVTLGTLRFETASTDASKREALDAFVESLSFDPWHALVEHRPLGSVMRARKPTYYASTQARKAIAEPDGTEWSSWG